MNAVLVAGAWCALLLAAQVLRARAYGRKPLFAPAAGSPAAGARYAFTGAMLPWAKESVRMNPASYAAGIAYHLGIAAAFARVLVPSRLLSALALLGAAAGCALLVKRIAKPHLRGLSNADDFASNLLATAFAATAAVPAAERILPWACAALLVYIPLGKIRHCVFFFLSRYHLGAFFGRRGTFPPAA
ncbi:hypothetical protein [Mesoterricola silvestris]|uniref:Uncharacterized protein n=1 Tax=Mesoterricola silvestris TaxID=2927979 RepID=A0AA48KD22_9BACT|nr:hypothetical protein [Mesoterricola silvestris]BDU74078.1 hypothetical protein METEAL_32520 [Mesoterricola silvestris]